LHLMRVPLPVGSNVFPPDPQRLGLGVVGDLFPSMRSPIQSCSQGTSVFAVLNFPAVASPSSAVTNWHYDPGVTGAGLWFTRRCRTQIDALMEPRPRKQQLLGGCRDAVACMVHGPVAGWSLAVGRASVGIISCKMNPWRSAHRSTTHHRKDLTS
jgi:hypothetical protein